MGCLFSTISPMELTDLVESRSYTIRYGADDEEHEFDGSVFDHFVVSEDTGERWPAFQRAGSAPVSLLFDPDKILSITPEK